MANLTSQALLNAIVARYELNIAGPLQGPILALLDRAIESGANSNALGATLLRLPQVRNALTEEYGDLTTGPSLGQAITELQGVVEEVEAEATPEEPVVPADLTEALQDLQEANAAKETFLETNETSEAAIAANLPAAQQALATARLATSDNRLNADVANGQNLVDAAEADIAAVAGLTEAVAALDAAEAAQAAAEQAEVDANAELQAQQEAFEQLHETIAFDEAGVIVDGELVLEFNQEDNTVTITEAGQGLAGIDALVAAFDGAAAAQQGLEAAQTAVAEAQTAVNELDLTPAAAEAKTARDDAQAALDAHITANGETEALVAERESAQAEFDELQGAIDDAEAAVFTAQGELADAEDMRNEADTELTAANTAVVNAQGELSDAEGVRDAAQTTLTDANDAVVTAQGELTTAEGVRDAADTTLTDANAAVDTAQGDLTAAEGVRDAAQNTLTEAEEDVTAAEDELTFVQGVRDAAQNTLTEAEEDVTAAEGELTSAQVVRDAAQTTLTDADAAVVTAETAVTTFADLVSDYNDAIDAYGMEVTPETELGLEGAYAALVAGAETGNFPVAVGAAEIADADLANEIQPEITVEQDALADAVTAAQTAAATAQAAFNEADLAVTAAEGELAAAQTAAATAQTEFDDAVLAVTAAEGELAAAQTAAATAQTAFNDAVLAVTAAEDELAAAQTAAATAQTAFNEADLAVTAAEGELAAAQTAAATAQAAFNEADLAVTAAEGELAAAQTAAATAQAAFDDAVTAVTAAEGVLGAAQADLATAQEAQPRIDELTAQISELGAALTVRDELQATADNTQNEFVIAAETNPLYAELLAARGELEAAEAALEARNELIGNVEEAQQLVDELAALNDAIDTAEAWFTDQDLALPVSLDGDLAATEDGDIFLFVEDTDSAFTITGFGEEGIDSLFFGADAAYSLVSLAELGEAGLAITDRVGDNNTLEIFWAQDGDDLQLFVESDAAAGFDRDGLALDQMTQITLAGFNANDIANFDGQLLIAGVAPVAEEVLV